MPTNQAAFENFGYITSPDRNNGYDNIIGQKIGFLKVVNDALREELIRKP